MWNVIEMSKSIENILDEIMLQAQKLLDQLKENEKRVSSSTPEELKEKLVKEINKHAAKH